MVKQTSNNYYCSRKGMYHFVEAHINDDYIMNVLYYTLRKTMASCNLDLSKKSHITISEKFIDRDNEINISNVCNNTSLSLALLLSIRALMLKKNLMGCCQDDYLVYSPYVRYDLSDVIYLSSLMTEFLADKDFCSILSLLEKSLNQEFISPEEIENFKCSTVAPEERNLDNYCKLEATKGIVTNDVIGNCAFVMDEDLEEYTVNDNIEYIGNTAFSFCSRLKKLTIKGTNVKFGRFPIIECETLHSIIVPVGTANYYKEALPYYSDIIHEEIKDTDEQVGEEILSEQSQMSTESVLNSKEEGETKEINDSDEELTTEEKNVEMDIVNTTINKMDGDKSPGIKPTDVDGSAVKDIAEDKGETNADFKIFQLVKGTVKEKDKKNYIVHLENGKDVSIPLEYWITKLPIVGKKMVLKKEGFDSTNHKTLWRVMTVI